MSENNVINEKDLISDSNMAKSAKQTTKTETINKFMNQFSHPYHLNGHTIDAELQSPPKTIYF